MKGNKTTENIIKRNKMYYNEVIINEINFENIKLN